MPEDYRELRRKLVGPFCPRCGKEIYFREEKCRYCNWPWPKEEVSKPKGKGKLK